MEIDPDLVIPNKNLSIAEGAIVPWTRSAAISGLVLPAAGGRRQAPRLQRQAAGARADEGAARRHPLRRQGPGGGELRGAQRPPPQLGDQVRGRGQQPGAPPQGDRLRVHAPGVRALHGDGALPDLQGRPPQARIARGEGRRQEHHRDDCDEHHRRAAVVRQPRGRRRRAQRRGSK